jgi:hypothetical protein
MMDVVNAVLNRPERWESPEYGYIRYFGRKNQRHTECNARIIQIIRFLQHLRTHTSPSSNSITEKFLSFDSRQVVLHSSLSLYFLQGTSPCELEYFTSFYLL